MRLIHFRHKFVPFKVDNQMERVNFVRRTGEAVGSYRVTDVYERCSDCPKTRIREVDGIWELSDLVKPETVDVGR